MWLPLVHPLLGTWPATLALTGNRTGDPLVHRLELNPLSYSSQGLLRKLKIFINVSGEEVMLRGNIYGIKQHGSKLQGLQFLPHWLEALWGTTYLSQGRVRSNNKKSTGSLVNQKLGGLQDFSRN